MRRASPRGIFALCTALLLTRIARADTLGPPPSADASPSLLATLPAFVPLALGAAAMLMLATLARRRPPRARVHAGIATVTVRPPSQSGEASGVLRAAGAVVLTALAVAVASARATRPATSDLVPRAGGLAPFQIAYGDVAPSLQRSYRALRDAVVAAEKGRATSGRWPDVAVLAAEGIAPFAPAPGVASDHAWTFRSDGAGVSYVGIPAGTSGAPAMLVAIGDPAPNDDTPGETHRLPNGNRVLVSIWFRPAGVALAPPTGVVARPQAERWIQIVAGGDR